MVTKPTKEDTMQALLHAETELLTELEQCVFEAEGMDSPLQHTLQRIQAEVIAIYAPLREEFDDPLE